MRKFILPLLVAGAVAFTASQAMAAIATNGGTFVEETQGIAGNPNTSDHYKKTDVVESGAGNFQIDSAYLKALGNTFDGDASYGYTTGKNPFVPGRAGEPAGATDWAIVAPAYSVPCPTWVYSTVGGGCPANVDPLSPQTEDPKATWDGTVLDDLYNVVGVNDGDWTSGGYDINGNPVNEVGTRRLLDQTLDALFYNGKRGTVTYTAGATTYTMPGQRHFNIDQTLDQDLADYEVTNIGSKEIAGIFGKLTQNYQLAGKELTKSQLLGILGPGWSANNSYASGADPNNTGCASWGGSLNGEDVTNAEKSNNCVAWDSTGAALGGTTFYDLLATSADPLLVPSQQFAAVIIEQWMVSEMYDWKRASGDSKVQGLGTKQEYSSYFRDGSNKNFKYGVAISGGHGTAEPTVALPNHGSMDP